MPANLGSGPRGIGVLLELAEHVASHKGIFRHATVRPLGRVAAQPRSLKQHARLCVVCPFPSVQKLAGGPDRPTPESTPPLSISFPLPPYLALLHLPLPPPGSAHRLHRRCRSAATPVTEASPLLVSWHLLCSSPVPSKIGVLLVSL